MLILGLFRQQDVSPRSGFEALLSRLEQKGLTQILRLPAISLDETERLITHLLGGPVERPVVRYIHTVAGGNPHYVCEATRALLGRNHLRREDDLWRLQTEMFVLRDRNDLRGRRGDSGDAQVPGNRGIMREIGTDYQRTLKSEDSRGRMRGDLTDQQWERVRSLLPPQKPRQGRPAKDHRRIVNGILWLNRTGGPWRNLPEEYGPWQTVATRFYRWHKAGVWDHILQALEWGDVADRLGSTGPDRSDTAATG